MLVRNTGGVHIATDGTRVLPGEVFDASEVELAAFGDKFEMVEAPQPEPVPLPEPIAEPAPEEAPKPARRPRKR